MEQHGGTQHRYGYGRSDGDPFDLVVGEIDSVASAGHGWQAGGSETPARRGSPVRGGLDGAYDAWVSNRTPENMSAVVDAAGPTITSEIARYTGSRTLLRSKAKSLVVRAVKTYDPSSGARLQSWIVTNLKPLSRYGLRSRPVRTPEVAARQAAELNRVSQELADELGRDPTDAELADATGMSEKRVSDVRRKAVASVFSSSFDESFDGNAASSPGVVLPDPVPFAVEAVYQGLSPEDRAIFDGITGSHGARQSSAKDVASMLHVSPANVSGRAADIARQISWIANNG